MALIHYRAAQLIPVKDKDAKHLLTTIAMDVGVNGEPSFPSYRTLSERTGIHHNTVGKKLDMLAGAGLIAIKRQGKRQFYTMLFGCDTIAKPFTDYDNSEQLSQPPRDNTLSQSDEQLSQLQKRLSQFEQQLSQFEATLSQPPRDLSSIEEVEAVKKEAVKLPPLSEPQAPHQSAYAAQFETLEPSVKDMATALRLATLNNNQARLNELARELVDMAVTPELITELFTGTGSYWLTAGTGSWSGGGRPNLGNIKGEILKALDWHKNGGGDAKKASREADLLHAEWIAPLVGMNGTGRDWFRQSPIRLKSVLRQNNIATYEQASRVKVEDLRVWFAAEAVA
jgi:DNA-binding transcriptional ArsR family regulator